MMNFLDMVEPFIVSDDKHVRDFALEAIERSYTGSEKTFLLALQAMGKVRPDFRANPIIHYTRNLPVTEKVLLEVLNRLDRKDGHYKWYLTILDYCPTELFSAYEERLRPYISKTKMDKILKLLDLDSEQLYTAAGELMNSLDHSFDADSFLYGKRIFQELIKRGEYAEDGIEQIRLAIKEKADEDFLYMNGVYHIYAAGELRAVPLIPDLATLLVQSEDDLLVEEVVAALIKIGTEEVLDAVEKYIEHEDTAIAALDIFASLKHPKAEETLLRHLDQEKDITSKTLIAESLCLQLSTKAIPKIVQMLEDGYDAAMVDLTEVLYPNCMINGIDHPQLLEWKREIAETDRHWEHEQKKMIQEEAKSKGIGRNDPCICGSGKKFKKCCGAQ
ncbi:SEC-C metal-binding domain-containing protein [Oceanobacillus massiliensis]|uniref:SEC-C metal-binding domain-containing protein n=1 Tax=Oceanobacillus massiliensis TaxID=1465765 RepID=UPI000287D273|nr:SEC-C metal-binding domain-containing protein [Oceanobacillus massiliensis]